MITFILILCLFIGYFYMIKQADIEIVIIKGLILGLSHTKVNDKDITTNYIDLYLGFIIITMVYND